LRSRHVATFHGSTTVIPTLTLPVYSTRRAERGPRGAVAIRKFILTYVSIHEYSRVPAAFVEGALQGLLESGPADT